MKTSKKDSFSNNKFFEKLILYNQYIENIKIIKLGIKKLKSLTKFRASAHKMEINLSKKKN